MPTVVPRRHLDSAHFQASTEGGEGCANWSRIQRQGYNGAATLSRTAHNRTEPPGPAAGDAQARRCRALAWAALPDARRLPSDMPLGRGSVSSSAALERVSPRPNSAESAERWYRTVPGRLG